MAYRDIIQSLGIDEKQGISARLFFTAAPGVKNSTSRIFWRSTRPLRDKRALDSRGPCC